MKNDYLADWIPEPNIYEDLAAEYHYRCQEYDMIVCGNERGLPTKPGHLGLINRHATKVLKEICETNNICNQSEKSELLKAIRKFQS